MNVFTSSRGRRLTFAVLCSLGGCDSDTCGAESLQLELTPSPACLQLSATVDTRAGYYKIVGTNTCAEPLVVHSPGTHDGGPNATFPAGGEVLIELSDSEVFNQSASVKTWQRNAVLGNETIVITMTKMPC
jgi:hypothetical protein